MTETREQELARLIREQAQDDRDFQAPEPGTVPYGVLLDIVDEDGVPQVPRLVGGPSCTLHGQAELRPDRTRGSGVACRACERERKARSRATKKDVRDRANASRRASRARQKG